MKHDDARANGVERGATGKRRPRCRLVGEDGNVYSIVARVRRALVDARDEAAAKEFVARAFASRSYDEVLALVMEYVDAY